MSFFEDSFNTTNYSKEQAEIQAEIKKLNEATEKMNEKSVRIKIKELRDAYHKNETAKLDFLADEFKEINDCLGNDSKETLILEKEKLQTHIEKDGANNLNIAKLKNCEAKLGIIDYKSIIKEAAGRNMSNNKDNYNYRTLDNQDGRKLRNRVLFGATLSIAAIIGIAGIASSCNKKNNVNETTTGSETISSIDQTTETITVTTSTGDYVVETVDPNYSSPTRETTDPSNNSNTNNGGNSGNSGNNDIDATTSSIRNTTPNNQVTVISQPTSPTTQPVSNETTTVQTDINGTQPGATEPEVKPSGKDTLPVEPTKITVDVNADPTPAPTKAPTEPTAAPTAATNATTEATKAPTPTPKPTPKPVPVETVDPNDPDNVVEKTNSKSKGKVLALKLN